MPIEIKIPPVGESINEVQISQWLKAEGDAVQQDEALAVIDSEKTTFELPATTAGRLGKILHQAGETVNVGDVVAHLEPAASAASPATPPTESRQPAKTKPPAPATRRAKSSAAQPVATIESQPAPAHAPAPAASTPLRPAATATEAPSNRQETEAAEAEANGPPGPSVPSTPTAAAPAPIAGREEEVVPMTMLRRTIARRLVEAQQTMAMLTTFNEVDMSAVQSLRQRHQDEFQKRHGVKLGLMSFFVKAAIDALKQFPQLNARLRDDDIIFHNYFDLGVAIATERGLVVPVLQRAERLSFGEIEKSIADFAQRARQGKLLPAHLEGGTFTITNGGVFGSMLSTPLINPPQSGILGLHAIEDRPVARQGQVVIRPIMYVALTYDHRLVDGREAVLFLRRIKEGIEEPARLLVEV